MADVRLYQIAAMVRPAILVIARGSAPVDDFQREIDHGTRIEHATAAAARLGLAIPHNTPQHILPRPRQGDLAT
jgi:hypothetical protein